MPNCLVFRFSTELTLNAKSQRGEVLSTEARARLLPGSPLPHHRFPHFCLPLRTRPQAKGLVRHCPPRFTPHPCQGLSPAHCLWTNQRVGHLGSTKPRRTQGWAQSRFESRPLSAALFTPQNLRVLTYSAAQDPSLPRLSRPKCLLDQPTPCWKNLEFWRLC